MELGQRAVRLPGNAVVVGARGLEGLDRLGVGSLAPPMEGRELLLSAPAHRFGQGGVLMAGEVEKGGRLAELLAEKEERQVGREGDRRRGQLLRLEGDQGGETFPSLRLPTWSWFWAATTKRSGGRSVEGLPYRCPRNAE